MRQTNTSSTHSAFLAFIVIALFSSCRQSAAPRPCTDAIGCVTLAPDQPVKIGVLQALSGKVAPLGQAQLRGLELALDKRERSLLGHSVALQIEDSGCTPEGGANSALKLIADPEIVAIFGTTCSNEAKTASQVMSAAGLTMISGNNSAPFLTAIAGRAAPDWHPGYFRTARNEENAGQAAARYVFQALGLHKAATIHDNDIYTRGLTESFNKAFTELGGEVVLDTAINKGETHMAPVLTAVVGSGAQVLFFPLFQPEGNHLLLQSRAMPALEHTLLIGGGALIEQSFLTAMGEAAKGMCFVGPITPTGEAVDRLAAAYATRYKEKPTVSYYLSGYDAADLLFHAIEQVAIRDEDGTLHLGRQALRDTLYKTAGFKGVTGNLTCSQFGDCAHPAFEVLRLDDPSRGLQGLQKNKVFSYPLTN